mgnify:CR=1 FL=1
MMGRSTCMLTLLSRSTRICFVDEGTRQPVENHIHITKQALAAPTGWMHSFGSYSSFCRMLFN